MTRDTKHNHGRLALAAVAAAGAAAVYVFAAWQMARAPFRVPLPQPASVGSPEAYVERKHREGERIPVRPGCDERLVRASAAGGAARTPLSIVYIHGFGACRAEGEAVVDRVAEDLGMNTFYTRLPGHGTNADDHASHSFAEYIGTAEETLAMGRELGDRVVVVGTSMGGLLATWLAAERPEGIAALVLASPFYEFARKEAHALELPLVLPLITALGGDVRDTRTGDPEGRHLPGFDDHWQMLQKYEALVALGDVRRVVARDDVFARVRVPVLLLYYYADERHQDDAASVATMRNAFAKFNGGHPDPRSRAVPIEDGDHILLSAYVRSDKAKITDAIEAFLRSLPVPESEKQGDERRRLEGQLPVPD
jgi:pimeloyl-ACP methyl ester carboxylesterase